MKMRLAALLAIMAIANLTAAENESDLNQFVRNARTYGQVVEQTFCPRAGTTFPTAWSFEGKTVSERHLCGDQCGDNRHSLICKDDIQNLLYKLNQQFENSKILRD